jgi:hypothetical protein
VLLASPELAADVLKWVCPEDDWQYAAVQEAQQIAAAILAFEQPISFLGASDFVPFLCHTPPGLPRIWRDRTGSLLQAKLLDTKIRH